ncbi:MAG: hypothetical protein KH454_01580 [Eggerthella sp.]|nr:hypothetical protein [Eggerthella sp.]
MKKTSIKEVVGLICETHKPGDTVTISIGSLTDPNRLSIMNAPSYVLDAITDNGYYMRAEFGAVVVSDESDQKEEEE